MASGSIHCTYQTALSCDICQEYDNVDSYCLGCEGNICANCKAYHTQIRMYRNHEIVPIIEGLKQQSATEKCSLHRSHTYTMHCTNCNKLVCTKCIIRDHKGHVLSDIETAMQRVQQELEDYHFTLKTILLPKCKQEETKITQNLAKCNKAATSLKLDINVQRAALKTVIDSICDDLLSTVEEEQKCQVLDIGKVYFKLQNKVAQIEQEMTKTKNAAFTKNASEKMRFNDEKTSITQLDIQPFLPLQPSTFTRSKINEVQVTEQVGRLVPPQGHDTSSNSIIDVTILHRQKFDMGILSSISAMNANQAWIGGDYYEKKLMFVNMEGKVMIHIDTMFDMDDFTVTTAGDIYATDYDGKCIRFMTHRGQVTETISTGVYKPSGICLINNQEIVVCVNTQDKHPYSKLVVYSSGDQKEPIRTVHYTDKPIARKAEYLTQRVTRNNRGDYCIAHLDHNKVYLVASDGIPRYTYDGNGEIKEKMLPWDVCSDLDNNLFISDTNNHTIHMLDDEGKFLRFVLTRQDGMIRPSGLCIDKNGRLLAGQAKGGLIIVKCIKLM